MEFAILAPLLILLLAGIAQLGMVGQTAMVARNAAREGARYATVRDPNARAHVIDYLNRALAGRADVVVPPAGSILIAPSPVPAQGNQVTVTVPLSVDVWLPLLDAVLPDPFPVTGTVTMRVTAP